MSFNKFTSLSIPALLVSAFCANNVAASDWYNLGPESGKLEGASVSQVYSRFSLNNGGQPVVVAVIDSGVDIQHEDLQGKIWVNDDEIPNNGIDDDNNGYIDDIHGWNFLGGADGSHLDADSLAVTREYAKYKRLIESGEKLSTEQQDYFTEVEANYNQALSSSSYQYWLDTQSDINYCKSVLATNGITDYSKASLEAFKPGNEELSEIKSFLLSVLETYGSYADVDKNVEAFKSLYDLDYDLRSLIVKDDPNDLREIGYGNNDVKGPYAKHGTHVAGIIAATRNNGLGINGIATNVKIMAIRAVTKGDERDKDVANAIRYAVDNGAHIINMSFAKRYSPHQEVVNEALLYAENNNVLLVRGAGNDGQNLDVSFSYYPNKYLSSGVTLNNWLTVGASSKHTDQLAFYSSNYGKEQVDLFAPGAAILSTTPDNQYQESTGSSFAAPVVSGIAALALSQFPELDVQTLIQYMLSTVRTYPDLQVKRPGASSEVDIINFTDLSASGGIINANALMEALYKDAGIYFVSNHHCAIKISPIYRGYSEDPRALENCVAKSQVLSEHDSQYYYVFVPKKTTQLRLTITAKSGNAELYASEAKNGWPTSSQHDFDSAITGNSDTIEINHPLPNQFYHIMVKSLSTDTDVSIKAELINEAS